MSQDVSPGGDWAAPVDRGRSGIHYAMNHVILQAERPAGPVVKLLMVVK